MSLKNLLTRQYLFQVNSVIVPSSDKVFFWIGTALFVTAIIIRIGAAFIKNPVDKKFLERMFKLFLTVGIFEILWFGARYQNIMFFGSHFVALLIFLIGLVWLILIAVSFIKNYSRQKEAWQKEQVKLKYLKR